MSKKGYSQKGLFGDINHYDENEKKIGESRPRMFGGYTNYDANGKKVGRSNPGLFGGYNHYDNHGKKVGHSDPKVFGGYKHYDSKHKCTGSSNPNFTGGYNHNSSAGCYVATCVYGSYDCPEVWTLRRFRDYRLAKNIFGRAFIKSYYAISPMVVKWIGHTIIFKTFWRKRLNRLVKKLQEMGYDCTPYDDLGD